MRPNSVTCSIILKSLTAHSAVGDVKQAMELIDSMQEDMDEVLSPPLSRPASAWASSTS